MYPGEVTAFCCLNLHEFVKHISFFICIIENAVNSIFFSFVFLILLDNFADLLWKRRYMTPYDTLNVLMPMTVNIIRLIPRSSYVNL